MAILAVIVALVFATTFLARPLLGGGWFWDAGNGLGFVALAGLLFQMVPAQAPRAVKPHEWLGYAVFGAVIGHALWFLLGDPVVRVYLQPGAPLAMWLGLGGLLALAALTLLARMPDRMRLHPGYRAFRKLHRWLAYGAVAGGGLHVLLTRFYLASPLQAAALALLAVAACVARRPWARIDPDPTPPVAGYLALGAVAVVVFAVIRNLPA